MYVYISFQSINQTGQALIERYHQNTPIASAVRYSINLKHCEAANRPIHILPTSLVRQDMEDAENWTGFNEGGYDFPVINFEHYFGKPYDHFWAAGFGTVVPDRFVSMQQKTSNKK